MVKYQAEVAKRVQEVRSQHTELWSKLIEALQARAEHLVDNLVSSQPETLSFFQGRAYEARQLVKELLEAPQLADQINLKERQDAAQRRNQ